MNIIDIINKKRLNEKLTNEDDIYVLKNIIGLILKIKDYFLY